MATTLGEATKLAEGDVVVIPATSDENPGGLNGLVWVVERLLGPGGCPWDQEQTHQSLKKHLIEESHELFDAIDAEDLDQMREELGDVLLQPLMHAEMQRLEGNWGVDEVAVQMSEKLIRRHPHVFGDVDANDSAAVLQNWDRIKKTEKGDTPRSLLAGVPKGMPALLRAYDISKRVARNGFEWPDFESVWDKLREEELELREAVEHENPAKVEDEVGDLLFTAVNVARWAGVEPEEALRKMLNRFTERFMAMERMASKPLSELTAEEWDELWNRAKLELSK
jgi:tetrapyrrole methylase family protein/MazG family protein